MRDVRVGPVRQLGARGLDPVLPDGGEQPHVALPDQGDLVLVQCATRDHDVDRDALRPLEHLARIRELSFAGVLRLGDVTAQDVKMRRVHGAGHAMTVQ